jgi:predicted nucleotide-binding protein
MDISNYKYLVDEGRSLLSESVAADAHDSFGRWDCSVAEWLDECFPNSGMAAEWSALTYSNLQTGEAVTIDPADGKAFRAAAQERLSWLSRVPRAFNQEIPKSNHVPVIASSRKVFVVHGHETTMKESVARFLTKLELEPIILHEQSNEGKTILEKFEINADVAYAIVLLTDDDRGRSAAAPPDTESKRARQNVIFELGYFFGRLGRKKVCALYSEGVEIPSDLFGLVYTPIDKERAWQFELAKEIKSSGVTLDLNRLI